MTTHDEFLAILATGREAGAGEPAAPERAAAEAHLATCLMCRERSADLDAVDALLSAVAEPKLPARLARPFASVLREHERASATAPRFAFGSLMPAAIALVMLVALSVFLWTVNTADAPVAATPTLTSTLTPTTISAVGTTASRETGPAFFAAFAAPVSEPPPLPEAVPTPAPAPAPGRNAAIGFAGSAASATISH